MFRNSLATIYGTPYICVMTHVELAIEAIAQAAKKLGLPEFARRADVPYTTVFDWSVKDFRPKALKTFDKLVEAAHNVPDRADED